MAAALLAVVGSVVVIGLAQAGQAGQRALLGAQARRLLQGALEQVRSGGGIPASGQTGPFTIAVSTSTGSVPIVLGGLPAWTPDCYGASPCSNVVTTSGVSALTYVAITVTYTADGSVLARGTTTTAP